MDIIQIIQKNDLDIPFQLRDRDGYPVTSYTEDSSFECAIWAGDDTEPLAHPTVTWFENDPASGKAIIRITSADTSNLIPSVYKLLVNIVTGPAKVSALECWLKVKPSPGVNSALRIYGTYQKLLQALPNLDEMMMNESTQAGFAEEREAASRWLDAIILSKVRNRPYLKKLLEDGRLEVSPEVENLITYKSLALILEGKLTAIKGPDDPYTGLAQNFQRKADDLARTLTVYVEGYPPLNLGSIPNAST